MHICAWFISSYLLTKIYNYWKISLYAFCGSHLNPVILYLQEGLQRLRDFPLPFWLALFVEGTRFTQAKLLAAQEYATSNGLPVPRNVLIPRTKVSCNCLIILNSLLLLPFHTLEIMSPKFGLDQTQLVTS